MKKLLCVAATAAVLMAPMMSSAFPIINPKFGTCHNVPKCKTNTSKNCPLVSVKMPRNQCIGMKTKTNNIYWSR